ncbi:MarP family serine protease [Actinocrinis puniceicyclus]|uniref:MarP family serine protease n=1 Tax=Actinocrinis puniceicyclus TaxID=977794 RepID=A0A8J7WN37_9ACTN|nr:MarP family serine protease [Actinocrinis puniceicyclus]MBS2962762.1 MarP family serine protease [Actinocrinis puniceicyclus]
MDLLDLILIIIAIAFAVSGYRQGFVVGVLSFFGFVGGLLLGLWLVPMVIQRFTSNTSLVVSTVSLCAVLALAVLGQVLATALGGRVRGEITWRPVQAVDQSAGAAVSVISVMLVAWFLGLALVNSTMPVVSQQVRGSALLNGMKQVLPANAQNWFHSFASVLDRSGFPQVFAPFTHEQIANVPPPDPAVLNEAGVVKARNSIVKIVGNAPSCGKQIEGSGFVFASQHVMTNAHVVGGVSHPTVQVGGEGRLYRATVVLFDPTSDIAVLYVPGLHSAPLAFDTTGASGDNAVVAGFPEDGPFTPVAARVRQEINAQGQDIYQRGSATRDIFSLYAQVLQGNSGGPLLTRTGEVYGVVFAKSLEDASTGYALTANQVGPDAQRGASETAAVDTQGCAI